MCFRSENQDHSQVEESTVSRRDLFRKSATGLMAGGTTALLAQSQARGQSPAAPSPILSSAVPQPPLMQKGVIYWGRDIIDGTPESILAERQGLGKTTGLKFRGLVRHADTLSLETLTLLPIHPLQVVIRMQASQTCYSSVGQLNATNTAPFAAVAGHGGVGVVEEVGRLVKRVKIGDQVFIATTPNCSVCSNCLGGRGDLCASRLPAIPRLPCRPKYRFT